MVRGLELVLLDDLKDGLSRQAYFQDAYEGVLWLELTLVGVLTTEAEQLNELVGKLLEINHYLLFAF